MLSHKVFLILHIKSVSEQYVDDIITAVPLKFAEALLSTFNSFHPRLQFILEIGINNNINFLDITMCFIHGCIQFDWFHKPTFSGRYLHFQSFHPSSH